MTATKASRTATRATRTAPGKTAPRKQPTAPRQKPATAKTAAPKAEDQKVVRDGFTMPSGDYDLLKMLKEQCLTLGVEVKKSELLRAGVQALASMSPDALADRMRALPALKTGRKKKKV